MKQSIKENLRGVLCALMAAVLIAGSGIIAPATVYANSEEVQSYRLHQDFCQSYVDLNFSQSVLVEYWFAEWDVNQWAPQPRFIIPIGTTVNMSIVPGSGIVWENHPRQDHRGVLNVYVGNTDDELHKWFEVDEGYFWFEDNWVSLLRIHSPADISTLSHVFDNTGEFALLVFLSEDYWISMGTYIRVTDTPAQKPTPNEISVTIGGTAVNFADQLPTIIDGRTLVPVRGVFEALGFDVDWNGELRQVTLTRAADTIILTLDSATFTTNGESLTLDVPAQSIGGRTMLPIRSVLESVGYGVSWDGVTQTVIIT